MKLTHVMESVNNNPKYYLFVAKQIIFWNKFDIKFICVFVGENIPYELKDYKDNIILWTKNLDLNTSYVAQNIRMYYPALINLPDNELIMITDMDMLPTNDTFYKKDLDKFTEKDFIYYRHVDGNQIYMCYNAANPKIWSKLFHINNENDIEKKILENYDIHYDSIPGSIGWFIDQEIMYKNLINYENLKILNRPIKRLEIYMYKNHLLLNHKNFISMYDDVHFHRSYIDNEQLILDAENQLKYI